MLAKIKSLMFGIMSPDDIRKMSVMEVKTHELYDKDGHPIEGGIMDPHLGVVERSIRCKTCGNSVDKCFGHFGHLELVRPVIHPAYYKKIEQLIMSTCRNCGRVLLSPSEIEEAKKIRDLDTRIKFILGKASKTSNCHYCGDEKLKYKLDAPTNFYIVTKNEEGEEVLKRLYPNEIRAWLEKLLDSDLKLYGYKDIRPEYFILTVLPIPPVQVHPSIVLDGAMRSEDDLTYKLVDIVLNNNRLRDNINAGAPQLMIEDLWNLLQLNITTYFNNNTPGVPPSKHRTGRLLKTLVQRIKGKGGIIRQNLIGKRVNYAGRSTVSPDIYLKADEVGLPKAFTDELSLKEKVTSLNIEDMRNMILNSDDVIYVIKKGEGRKKVIPVLKEQLAAELQAGDIIERKLRDGDIVLFNRYPSLHRLSIMAHKVRKTKGNTIRFNPIASIPYNADFDGDEMQIHVPQKIESIVEAEELISVEKNVVSPRHGGIIVAPLEDIVSCSFVLTMPTTKVSKADAMNYFKIIGKDLPEPDLENGYYSGRLIFSALLPKDMNISFKTDISGIVTEEDKKRNPLLEDVSEVVIENGVMKRGVLDKHALKKGTAKVIYYIQRKYGNKAVLDFYNKLVRIVLDIGTKKGLTSTLDEVKITENYLRYKEKVLNEFIEESKDLEKQYKSKKLKRIPGKNLHESFEAYIMRKAYEAKKKVESHIVKGLMDKIFSKDPEYNSLILIFSGARGKIDVLTNMFGLWGQVAVREKRPWRGFSGRVLSYFLPNQDWALPKGFIKSSFYSGLDPKEVYFQAMGARQGEVDTGVSTKISGYLNRRISHATRDLFVAEDKSVRNTAGKIIQFVYGEDAIYPQNMEGDKFLGDAFFSVNK